MAAPKLLKRHPGQSRYAEPGEQGHWSFCAWQYRRALKLGKTSHEQDIMRCYEAIPRKMYARNCMVAEERRPFVLEGKGGDDPCCPTKYV